MKKYKLLKDTPVLSKGEVLYLKEDNTGIEWLHLPETDEKVFRFDMITKEEEWVEEVVKKITINDVDWNFNPKNEERYYYVDEENEVGTDIWLAFLTSRTKFFKTEQEAQAVANWNKALEKIRRRSDFKPDWGDSRDIKYYIYSAFNDRRLAVDKTHTVQRGMNILPCYRTRKEAEEALEKYEKEYKILFGIE